MLPTTRHCLQDLRMELQSKDDEIRRLKEDRKVCDVCDNVMIDTNDQLLKALSTIV